LKYVEMCIGCTQMSAVFFLRFFFFLWRVVEDGNKIGGDDNQNTRELMKENRKLTGLVCIHSHCIYKECGETVQCGSAGFDVKRAMILIHQLTQAVYVYTHMSAIHTAGAQINTKMSIQFFLFKKIKMTSK